MKLQYLKKPFLRSQVHWRIQGSPYAKNGKHFGLALAYIDARDVQDRLDAVCGPIGWQCRFSETAKGRVICEIGIKVDGEWIWKADGAGDTAVEGEKGGVSDALKRAAVAWGVGRYLYRLPTPWVPCEVRDNRGKTAWKKWAVDPWDEIKEPPFGPEDLANRCIAFAEAGRPIEDEHLEALEILAPGQLRRVQGEIAKHKQAA